jgi:hypothetical protein
VHDNTPIGGPLAHLGVPGAAAFIAMGLFFAGIGAAWGAYFLYSHPRTFLRRATGIGLGVVAFGCFGLGTALPLILHATPSPTRPSTRARLEFLSPTPDEAFRGSSATIPVQLRLVGGRIVPISSLHLVPNEGHIHLYLDGSLVAMTGLTGQVTARPGQHTLRAEFVAIDHGPFHPRVVATVVFEVRP